MKKKILKKIALITAFILILGLSWLANALLGNPISKMLATNTAKKHLEENYPDTDYYIEKIAFNFKSTNYYAHIKSPTSIDTEFTLYLSMFGELTLDTYEDVANGSFSLKPISHNQYLAYTSNEQKEEYNNSIELTKYNSIKNTVISDEEMARRLAEFKPKEKKVDKFTNLW